MCFEISNIFPLPVYFHLLWMIGVTLKCFILHRNINSKKITQRISECRPCFSFPSFHGGDTILSGNSGGHQYWMHMHMGKEEEHKRRNTVFIPHRDKSNFSLPMDESTQPWWAQQLSSRTWGNHLHRAACSENRATNCPHPGLLSWARAYWQLNRQETSFGTSVKISIFSWEAFPNTVKTSEI